MTETQTFQDFIRTGIPAQLPAPRPYEVSTSHAPNRNIENLTIKEKKLALKNALRYFPAKYHETLLPEFLEELNTYGRIYMHRLRPHYAMHARPISDYPCKTKQAAAIMLMIQNNLDPKVAKYLSEMTETQTLVLYSGHPLGLFPSHKDAPRVVVTNGMMIPNYSKKEDWNKYNALGVTQYGQMTAGSFMYIGPQGIVHGTTITLLNAGRKLGLGTDDLAGKVYVTSGLGGMSGAQALAAIITGAIGVIAEIDPQTVEQRVVDGYVSAENIYTDVDELIDRIEDCRAKKEGIALVFQGNIVTLWERMVERKTKIELAFRVYFCGSKKSVDRR